jgi:rhamnosyltransferase
MYPKVVVLLASYNGEKYIYKQIESIARQVGVTVSICISDDGSSDNTLKRIEDAYGLMPGRISILNKRRAAPLSRRSSANNFYHLIATHALPADAEWVAFSDQDDIWDPLHLKRAISKTCEYGVAGYSSSVVAFWPDGRRRLIVKSGHISKYNHFFEAPGPGCSFVLSRSSFESVQAHIRSNLEAATRVKFHDWAIYAILRSKGGAWLIDSWPSLLYRQHASNVIGVQLNYSSIVKRIRMLLGGWYLDQCIAISELLGQSGEPGPGQYLLRFSLSDRFRLAYLVALHRRRLRDRVLLPFAFLTMKSAKTLK